MATKYVRDSETSEAIEARRTPWIRQGPPTHRISRRQRVFIILMGLCVLGLLGQIAYRLNHDVTYSFQPVRRGEGAIVERIASENDAESGTILLEINTGQHVFTAKASVPAPYWAALSEGDRVAVAYRISKLGNALELLESGLVALPDQNR